MSLSPLPQSVAQHDHPWPVRHVLVFRNETSKSRAHTEGPQEALRNEAHVDLFRLGSVVGQRRRAVPNTADGAEGGHIVPIGSELGPGARGASATLARQLGMDDTESIRLWVWERLQQHAVDHGKDRNVGADAERQSGDDNQSETGTPCPGKKGNAKILRECLHDRLL